MTPPTARGVASEAARRAASPACASGATCVGAGPGGGIGKRQRRRRGDAHRISPVHRPGQSAVCEHQGRRLRESNRRAVRAEARVAGEELRVSAADEFHTQHAAIQAARRRLPLRHRDERARGLRSGVGDHPVLPLDLCARVSKGQGPRPGPDRRRLGRAAAGPAKQAEDRHLRQSPASTGSSSTDWRRRRSPIR